jgi:23S rRNA pseudouridine2457 synthase
MIQIRHRYFIINKPYNMVSQFVSPDKVGLLGELNFDFPEGIHAIGRLDNHSEGLLILTTDKRITRLLFEGKTPHKRTYLVQVKNKVDPEDLRRLQTGVIIRVKGGLDYNTAPCDVEIVPKPAHLFKRGDGYYEDFPQDWLRITVTEGKFHQIRKMVFAIHHPCKRLIRLSIEDLLLEKNNFFKKLKISNRIG